MKIEIISDSQVKFILNKSDLAKRDLKINELAYGTEKMADLFKEMMDKAISECGFEAEGTTPLMIEAMPISSDSIMVMVTKVDPDDEPRANINLLPASKRDRRFIKNSFIEPELAPSENGNVSVFVFKNLDGVTVAAKRLEPIYFGTNDLYKREDKYYLLIDNKLQSEEVDIALINNILCEYSEKLTSHFMAKSFITEHGEKIIRNNAISVLANL